MSHIGVSDKGWYNEASCKDVDPSSFYPDQGEYALAKKAKSICKNCPVRVECLVEAFDSREHGIWGGFSERQRKSIWRKMGHKVDLTFIKKAIQNDKQ